MQYDDDPGSIPLDDISTSIWDRPFVRVAVDPQTEQFIWEIYNQVHGFGGWGPERMKEYACITFGVELTVDQIFSVLRPQ